MWYTERRILRERKRRNILQFKRCLENRYILSKHLICFCFPVQQNNFTKTDNWCFTNDMPNNCIIVSLILSLSFPCETVAIYFLVYHAFNNFIWEKRVTSLIASISTRSLSASRSWLFAVEGKWYYPASIKLLVMCILNE